MKAWRKIAIPGLFLLGGLVAFSGILNAWFLSDDFAQIGKILGGDLSVVWGREHGGFFRPLFILSYFVDKKFWGAQPLGFHLTNVVLHSLNAFLVFHLSLSLLKNLKLTKQVRRMVSIGASALFLLHPSHSEAVSWISGRADVLATCFCLVSLLNYLASARSKRVWRLTLSLLCFAFALLAKESSICLPFLVLVLELLSRVGRNRLRTLSQGLRISVLYFSILLAFVAVRSFFIGSVVGGYGIEQHLNFSPGWLRDRLLEASVRSVLPALPGQLSWYLFKPLQSRVFWLTALSSAGLVAAAIIFRRRRYGPSERREQNALIAALVLLFLFALLPVINLRLNLYHTLGERFLYLPSVFSCLLLAYLLTILVQRPVVWVVTVGCILGFYSWRLQETNVLWRATANLSRSLTRELADSAKRGHVIILNAPDNVRGVPLFHNGLPEALEDFQNQKQITQVDIIAFQDLQSAADGVDVTSQTETLRLRLLNEQDSLARVAPSQCLQIAAQSRSRLELLTMSCADDADLFFFSQGSMHRLPAAGR